MQQVSRKTEDRKTFVCDKNISREFVVILSVFFFARFSSNRRAKSSHICFASQRSWRVRTTTTTTKETKK